MTKPSLGTTPSEILGGWKVLSQQQVGRIHVLGNMIPGPTFTWMNVSDELKLAIVVDSFSVSPATPAEEAEVFDAIAKGQMEIKGYDRSTHKHVIYHQATGLPLEPVQAPSRKHESEGLSM